MLQFGNISFDSIFWFCVSGKSFFWGLLLLLISVFVPGCVNKKWALYILHLLRICALLFIIVSSAPINPLLYTGGFILLVASSIRTKKHILFKTLFAVYILLGASIEFPYHIPPHISTNNVNCICVIGDSVSAGMGNKNEQTWPDLLKEKIGIKTVNLARAGATAESALKQSELIPDNNCLIILEIGGNDLLVHTPTKDFEAACNELLENLNTCENIVWLELPLLPQHYPYGRIQRRLARQHNITLIPKSILANVFCTKGATSDGIHLSQTGHTVMASEIQQLIKKE